MYTSALFDHKQMGTGKKNKRGKREEKNPFWVHSRTVEWGCGSAPMSRLEIVCLGREYTKTWQSEEAPPVHMNKPLLVPSLAP